MSKCRSPYVFARDFAMRCCAERYGSAVTVLLHDHDRNRMREAHLLFVGLTALLPRHVNETISACNGHARLCCVWWPHRGQDQRSEQCHYRRYRLGYCYCDICRRNDRGIGNQPYRRRIELCISDLLQVGRDVRGQDWSEGQLSIDRIE